MHSAKREQAESAPAGVAMPHHDVVALVLQGGGALGAYQAGVFEGLHEAGVRPNWLAGISIGALNAAVIAGSKSSTPTDCANSGRRSAPHRSIGRQTRA